MILMKTLVAAAVLSALSFTASADRLFDANGTLLEDTDKVAVINTVWSEQTRTNIEVLEHLKKVTPEYQDDYHGKQLLAKQSIAERAESRKVALEMEKHDLNRRSTLALESLAAAPVYVRIKTR
jgi:ribosomal protein L4